MTNLGDAGGGGPAASGDVRLRDLGELRKAIEVVAKRDRSARVQRTARRATSTMRDKRSEVNELVTIILSSTASDDERIEAITKAAELLRRKMR